MTAKIVSDNILNIKNIIEPYEKRIKELEEALRTKDFEIAVLKQKLFNLNKGQNLNQEISNYNSEYQKINIKFIDWQNNEKILRCKSDEKTKKVFENYLNNSLYEVRELKFIYRNNILKSFLSLKQNEIVDNSVIRVEPKNLITLIFDYQGFCMGLNFDKDTPIGLAFIYYLIEIEKENYIMNLINNEKSISFIWDLKVYNLKNQERIKNVFPHLTKIKVIEHGNMIGGH